MVGLKVSSSSVLENEAFLRYDILEFSFAFSLRSMNESLLRDT